MCVCVCVCACVCVCLCVCVYVCVSFIIRYNNIEEVYSFIMLQPWT